MKRFLSLGAGALLLSGCALPVPIQIASWALDGLSYITTEKTVADHGISLIAQQDCAVLRGLLHEGDFCRDFDDATTVLAEKGTDIGKGAETAFAPVSKGSVGKGSVGKGNVSIDSDAVDVEALANFDTAAGGNEAPLDSAKAVSPEPSVVAAAMKDFPLEINVEVETASLAKEEWKAETVIPAAPVDLVKTAVNTATATGDPSPGLYFVIGSFREHGNASRLRSEFKSLTPSVLATKLGNKMLFRVVVGPFGESDAQRIHKTIYAAGISDSWAIRVNPGEWSMAMILPPAKIEAEIVAEAATAKLSVASVTYVFDGAVSESAPEELAQLAE
ncbi:MAG: SPOR domain-containing protein [Rhodospirillales bacterium]|nr:SPOR domain-containing protein [Rhodospirillales bacterium]